MTKLPDTYPVARSLLREWARKIAALEDLVALPAREATHDLACEVALLSYSEPAERVASAAVSGPETRHYIGMTPMGRLHLTLGPGSPAEFPTPPTEPATLANGSVLYPVSAEVAAEWDSFDAEGAAVEPWDDPALYEGWSLQGQAVETAVVVGERL